MTKKECAMCKRKKDLFGDDLEMFHIKRIEIIQSPLVILEKTICFRCKKYFKVENNVFTNEFDMPTGIHRSFEIQPIKQKI